MTKPKLDPVPNDRFKVSNYCLELEIKQIFEGMKINWDKIDTSEKIRNAMLGEIDDAFEEHCLVELLKDVEDSIYLEEEKICNIIDEVDDLSTYEKKHLRDIIHDRVECELFLLELPKDLRKRFLASDLGKRYSNLKGLNYEEIDTIILQAIKDDFERYCFFNKIDKRMDWLTKFREHVSPGDWSEFTSTKYGRVYETVQARYGLESSLTLVGLNRDFADFLAKRIDIFFEKLDPISLKLFEDSWEYRTWTEERKGDDLKDYRLLKTGFSKFKARQALLEGLTDPERDKLDEIGIDPQSIPLRKLENVIDHMREVSMLG